MSLRPTEMLSREHKVVLEQLDQFSHALNARDLSGVRTMLRFFDERLILHRRKEEEVLFPVLGQHIGTEQGPIACMLSEHREEQQKIEEIRAALNGGESAEVWKQIPYAGQYIVELLRQHILKEDEVLFPLAEQVLSEEQKRQVRAGMDRIGYCCPTDQCEEASLPSE